MGRNAGVLGAAAALLFVAGVSAQGRNFDGKWTLDAAKSGPPSSATGQRPASDFTIKTDAKTFVVTTTRSGEDTVMTYKIDGSDSWNTPAGRGAQERAYKFTWSGDKAVITSKAPGGEETTEYWLEGDSLVRQMSRPAAAGAAPTHVRTYFKRAK